MIYKKNGRLALKHKARRLLSGFLAMLMVIGLIPVETLAAPGTAINVPTDAVVQGTVNGETAALTGQFTYSYENDITSDFSVTAPETMTTVDAGKTVSIAGWDENAYVSVKMADGQTCRASFKNAVADGKTVTFELPSDQYAKNLENATAWFVVGANYLSKDLSITYPDSSAADQSNLTWGTEISLPTEVNNPDPAQMLLGWKDANDKIYPAGQTITLTDSLALTPVFQNAEKTQYIVTFMDGMGGMLQSGIYEAGETVTAPTAPTRVGYTFANWDSTVVTNVDADAIYTAQWTAVQQTIAYATGNYTYDGQPIAAATDEAVSVSVTAKDGHEITGVFVQAASDVYIPVGMNNTGSTCEFSFTMPAEAVTVTVTTAEVAKESYTVKFTVDGELHDLQTVTAGTKFEMPETPTKEGYDFDGWNDGTTIINAPVEVNSDITYKAVFTEVAATDYNITVNTDPADIGAGAEVATQSAKAGEVKDITITTPEGYAFKNVTVVDGNGNAVAVAMKSEDVYQFTMPASDVTVTANFVEIPADTYKIDFKLENGTMVDCQFVADGEKITAPTDVPEKEGYTFDGWYDDKENGTKLEDTTTATKDATYYARYTAGEVTVTYKDGTEADVVDAGEVFTVKAPKDEDNFICWSASDGRMMLVGEEYVVTSDITLTPVYQTDDAIYIVNFKGTDGKIYHSCLSTKDNEYEITTPAIPTIEGYDTTNAKWSYNGTDREADTNVKVEENADFTLTGAKAIEYNVTEGTLSNVTISNIDPKKTTAGTKVTFDAEAVDGYKISNVTVTGATQVVNVENTSGNEYAFTMPAEDVTISATAEAKTYTIDFKLDDGTMVDSQSVAYGTVIVPPANPDKDGYDFVGWFTKDGTEFTVDTTATSDQTYFARFKAKEFTITYENVDGTVYAEEKAETGDLHVVLTRPDDENKENFICWSASDGRMMLEGESYTITSDLTLTPVYQNEHDIYLVNFKGLDGAIYYSYLATHENGYMITTPEIPAIEGYDMSEAKWTYGTSIFEGKHEFKATESADYTLTGYNVESYKVEVNVTPGTLQVENSSANGAEYNSPVEIKAKIEQREVDKDYILKSVNAYWMYGDKKVGIALSEIQNADETVFGFTMPAHDVIVDVTYEEVPAEKVLVKFMNEDGLYDYRIVDKGSEGNVAPEAPTKAGSKFLNWERADGNGTPETIAANGKFTVNKKADDTIVYNAKWEAEAYTVYYDLAGGTSAGGTDSKRIEYGKTIELAAEPTKDGVTFIGWLSSETNTIFNAGAKYTVKDDVTFTAQWAANEYVVKFVDDETGVVYGYESVEHGAMVTAPTPNKTGYTLTNWVNSEDNAKTVVPGAELEVTESAVYYAEWTIKTFNVHTSTSNCTIEGLDTSYDYGEKVEFTVAADEKYVVDKVYITYTEDGTEEVKVLAADENGNYSFTMPGADVTVTAKAKQNEYQINTEPGEHTAIKDAPKKAEVGTDVTFTVESTNDNYTVGNVFVEAADGTRIPVTVEYEEGLLGLFDKVVYHFTMPEQDVTIKTQAVQGEYTVTYLDSDNTLLEKVAVKSGETTPAREQEAPEGYTFEYWDDILGDATYKANENITVTEDLYLRAVYTGVESDVSLGDGDNENLYLVKADQGRDMSNSVDLLNNRANTLKAKNGTTVYFQVAAKYNWIVEDITITSANGNSDLVVVPTLIAKSEMEVTTGDDAGETVELETYAFTMPAESVKINVYTEAKEYNVKVVENLPDAGDVTINGYTTTNRDVAQGSNVQVEVVPKAGYEVENVKISYVHKNGNEGIITQTVNGNVYEFTMVPYDVTVAVTYKAVDYSVNVTESNDATYDPGTPGVFGSALETYGADNMGYVVLYDADGKLITEVDKNTGIQLPANASYNVGNLVNFKVVTYRGWKFSDVAVTYADGKQSCQLTKGADGVYYFNMPVADDDVKITANFVKDSYNITKVLADGSEDHGTVTMNDLLEKTITSDYKDDVTVTVTPDAGYYVKSISYELKDTNAADFTKVEPEAGINWTEEFTQEQVTDRADGSHSIVFATPSSDVKVTVAYAPINYTIKSNVNGIESAAAVNDTDGGKITLSETTANVGDQIDITAEPKHGYKLVSLYAKDTDSENVPIYLDNTEAETGAKYHFNMPADAVTVYADFQKVDYVVTYVNYDNSVIGTEGVTYKDTANVSTFVNSVVTAPDGHHFVGWTSDDVETAVTTPSVTDADFVVINDTVITAQFEKDATNVVFNQNPNGTVESDTETTESDPFTLNKHYQDVVTFTAKPAVGYEIDSVTVMTQDVNNNALSVEFEETENEGEYTFKIPATYKTDVHQLSSADVIVNVTFKTTTYTLTEDAESGTNGTVAINGLVSTQTSYNYQYQDDVNITATPDAGYYVKSITATGAEDDTWAKKEVTFGAPAEDTLAGDAETLTFKMPAQDVTYKVVYAKITYTITRTFDAEEGKVETFNADGEAIDTAVLDDKVDVVVTPKKGYALKTLTVTTDNGTQSVDITGTDTNEFTFKMPAKAVNVTAVFTEVTYTAKLTQKGEGSTFLNTYFTGTMNADYKDTVTVNAQPASGWKLVSITVTGDEETGKVAVTPAINAAGGDYTFTMPNCNVEVEVVYEKKDYTITTVSDSKQGTVTTTPADSAQVDDIVKVKVEPKKGYELADLTVTYANGEKSVALTNISKNNFTFTMPAADVTVTAVYKTVEYEVTLDKSGKGTVELNGHNKKVDVNYTDTVTVEINPEAGWYLESLKVDDGNVAVNEPIKANGGIYTFTMPNRDVEVSVVLKKYNNPITTYAVNAYEDGHGKVTMNSASGQVGDNMIITADPDDGYRVKRVVVTTKEGYSVPVSFVSEGIDYLEKWSFTMPASAVDVKVVFEVYSASYYTDARTDDWYYEAVTYLADKGLMTGMTDNLFGPNILMTREMFVTVLARMEGVDVSEWSGTNGGFTDVSADGWYAPYVAWAKANGVTTGYEDGSGRFGVADPITREQMFTMMYRYAKSKGVDMTVTYPQFMDRYVDKDQISPYAYDALTWCISEGVAKGMSDTTINPLEYAPRSHAAQMFKNYIDNVWYR